MVVEIKDRNQDSKTVAVMSTNVHRVPCIGELLTINDSVFEVTHVHTDVTNNKIEVFIK